MIYELHVEKNVHTVEQILYRNATLEAQPSIFTEICLFVGLIYCHLAKNNKMLFSVLLSIILHKQAPNKFKQREDRLKIQFFVGGTDVTTVVQLSFYFRICSSFFYSSDYFSCRFEQRL